MDSAFIAKYGNKIDKLISLGEKGVDVTSKIDCCIFMIPWQFNACARVFVPMFSNEI